MSDPNQPGTMSVTIKADEPGGKYNDAKSPGSWIVFHGTPAAIREQIMDTFTFEESAKDLDLSELIVEATRMFKAVCNVATGPLAGRVLGGGGKQDSGSSSSAWAAAREGSTSTPAEEQKELTIAELIEAQESVDSLKELWLERSDDIKSEGLVDAWTKKGQALKEAATADA